MNALLRAGRATGQLARVLYLWFTACLFITVLLTAFAGTLVLVGVGLVPEAVLLLRRLAGVKRHLTATWTGEEIPEAYTPITGGLKSRLHAAVHDAGAYKDLRWMFLYLFYGLLIPLSALLVWLPALGIDVLWSGLLHRAPVALPLIARLADLEARWSGVLLRPAPGVLLAARVRELTTTRADAVSAHGAELRRIERDLHDGVQARLVAMSMRIGIARRAVGHDPASALRLLDDAHDQVEQALTELRHVVRGIHPPILTDRGLAGAVRALAASSGLDVAVHIEGLEGAVPRAPAAVEAAAYFVVSEALTNTAKHSGSATAEIDLARTREGLRLSVRDDGSGGVTGEGEAVGSGVLGMRRRVAALDGTFSLTSPPGGPTSIDVELPCAW